MPPLTLAFDDFWSGFDPHDNFLTRAFPPGVDWVLDDRQPDIVFFSNFGVRHLRRRHGGLRIFYSGENLVPDFNQCDYAISAARLQFGSRHLYLPPCLIAYDGDPPPALPPLSPEMAHRPFCSFLYSQARVGEGSRVRKQFCQELMDTYAHVDCPGRVLHNMEAPDLAARGAGDWHGSKIRFLSRYKFNIAFENSSSPGYITEKLTDCFLGNTVPIYRGSGGDVSPFPREAMICADDYPDTASLIARIREVNEDEELYLDMLAANPLRHGMPLGGGKALREFFAPLLQGQGQVVDKDVWRFGEAARLARLGAAAGVGRIRASYLLATLGLLVAGREKRCHLRERRRELKYALRDVRQLRG